MKNVLKNLVTIAIVIFLMFCIFSNTVFAEVDWSTKINGFDTASGDLDTATTSIMSSIISVVRIVAAGVAVIIIFVISIRYMLASAGEKADIKKHAVPYVIGAFVMFGASGILGLIQSLAETTFS